MGDGGNTNREVMLVKNLLTITVLVLFLGIASPSFAIDQMSLYTETPVEIVIAGEVSGDLVEEDFMDFYIDDPLQPQLSEEIVDTIIIAERPEPENDYINVFGVKVPSNSTRGAI